MNSVIKDFLMENFKEVTDVKFDTVRTMLMNRETIDRTRIKVLITPDYILEGNFDNPEYYHRPKMYKKIADALDSMFGTDISGYGSSYGLTLYVLTVENV